MRFDLKQIQEVWSRSLTAESISEPIEPISYSEDVCKAVEMMERNGFDVLGLQDENLRIIGYIEADNNVQGSCKEHCQTFEIESIVSLHTPLKDCMSHIANKKRLFVLGSSGIEGIITLADLHKQPIRMLLFSIISLLEMTMSKLIKMHYHNDSWCDKLPNGRLEKAQEIYKDRKRIGQEIDLDDCLQLCDKSCVLFKTDMLEDWKFESKGKAEKFFAAITGLRNDLAHSQENIYADISKVISLCDTAEQVIEVNIAKIYKTALISEAVTGKIKVS